MAESTGTRANSSATAWGLTSAARAVRVRSNVVDDVIRTGRIGVAVNAFHSIETVELKSVPDFPGDHMVGT